jgi:hypothetical protein
MGDQNDPSPDIFWLDGYTEFAAKASPSKAAYRVRPMHSSRIPTGQSEWEIILGSQIVGVLSQDEITKDQRLRCSVGPRSQAISIPPNLRFFSGDELSVEAKIFLDFLDHKIRLTTANAAVSAAKALAVAESQLKNQTVNWTEDSANRELRFASLSSYGELDHLVVWVLLAGSEASEAQVPEWYDPSSEKEGAKKCAPHLVEFCQKIQNVIAESLHSAGWNYSKFIGFESQRRVRDGGGWHYFK